MPATIIHPLPPDDWSNFWAGPLPLRAQLSENQQAAPHMQRGFPLVKLLCIVSKMYTSFDPFWPTMRARQGPQSIFKPAASIQLRQKGAHCIQRWGWSEGKWDVRGKKPTYLLLCKLLEPPTGFFWHTPPHLVSKERKVIGRLEM